MQLRDVVGPAGQALS